MSLKKEIRQQSRIDSRRFSKSIICRIITGELLSFLKSINFIPTGMFFDQAYGFCPVHQKVVVCPVIEYAEVYKIYENYKKSLNDLTNNISSKLEEKTIRYDVSSLSYIQELNKTLINLLSQKIAFVSLENIHDGKSAGLDPEKYDVAIDSLEVKNDNIGRYVIRNKTTVQRRGNI